MELPEDQIGNEAGWTAIVGGAILIAAAWLVRIIVKTPDKPENGQKEFRESIKRDIAHLVGVNDKQHDKIAAQDRRIAVLESRLGIRDG